MKGDGQGISDACLRVESGFYAGLEWPIGSEPTVIGRGRQADFMLGEATISRTHARVGREGEGFFLEDLGSTNGTQVNGKRVARGPLRDGDELCMGKLSLRLLVKGGERAQLRP